MNEQIITVYLCCPQCREVTLDIECFERDGNDIWNGVVSCDSCATWYRLEDGLLELLVPALRLPGTDAAFARRMATANYRWRYDICLLYTSPSPRDS